MARKQAVDARIEDPKKIAVLAAPIRVELATAIEALGGETTVAQLAAQLGRPADGLYYHLRAMVRGGLLEQQATAGGSSYRLAVPPGHSMRLRYLPGATANAKAVGGVVKSMSRLAQRDFLRALDDADTVAEGPRRELWAARLRGWLDVDELEEANRLLIRLADLLLATRPKPKGKLVMLHWMLAPLDAKPMRRKSVSKPQEKGQARRSRSDVPGP